MVASGAARSSSGNTALMKRAGGVIFRRLYEAGLAGPAVDYPDPILEKKKNPDPDQITRKTGDPNENCRY